MDEHIPIPPDTEIPVTEERLIRTFLARWSWRGENLADVEADLRQLIVDVLEDRGEAQ